MAELFFLEDISGDDLNPYEAVLVASKEARRINQARLMVEVSEEAKKPTTLALKRLSEGKVRLARGDEAGGAAGEEADGASEQEADSAGR